MSDQDATPEELAVLADIERYAATFDDIAQRIEKIADPIRAYRLADELAKKQLNRRGVAAMLRLRQVKRMHESSGMTYAQIGTEIGVTKQRVKRMFDQLAKDTTPTS